MRAHVMQNEIVQYCLIIALCVFVTIMPVSATSFNLVNTSIYQGTSVFIGEQDLNFTSTQNYFTEQTSFQPTIPSTVLVLQELKTLSSRQIPPETGGTDLSAGTACSLNKQSGGALQRISPQEEDEKILAVQEYIKKNNLSWTAGKTSVSNLTPAAYATLRGLKHPATGESYPVRSIMSTASLSMITLPESFDWRDNGGNWTTPIRDQGYCGSCWAFGSTATFESFWKRIYNTPDINPDFAEQYLVSCDSDDYGCDGGDNWALGYFVNKTGRSGGVGTVVESDYTYTGTDTTCKDLTGKTRYTVPEGGSWSHLAGDCVIDSVDNTKQAIYTYGPVNAYIYATDNFMDYTSGIFEDPSWIDGGPCDTNHVVDLVGWGHDPVKNKDYWIVKNSWGAYWGEDGWFRIYTDQCRIGEGVAYLAYPGSIVPVAYFTASPTYGTAPLTVKFTDSSTNTPISWNWSFGDGSLVNVTMQNPVHTYPVAGTYTVSLNATNAAGSNISTRTGYITVIAPVANFSASPTSGTAPLTVQFNDTSSGLPTSWNWNFGDGATSTLQNLSHVYSNSGYYTASLTILDSFGSTNTTSKEITVIAASDNNTFGINGTETNAGIITINTTQTASNGTVVTLSNNDTVITLTGLDANRWESFVIITDGVSQSPNIMSGNITGIVATTEPIIADLGGDIGEVEISIVLNLDTMPEPDAQLLQELVKNSSVEIRAAFQQAALNNHLTIKEIAYIVNLLKDNFLYTNPATIKMAINADWVITRIGGNPATIADKGAYLLAHKTEVEQKVKIFRNADNGSTEILTTQYMSYTDPKAYFEAESPHGLSTFGFASVDAVSTPDSGSDSGGGDDGMPPPVSDSGVTQTEIVNVGGGSAVTRAEMTGTGLGKNLVITAFPRSNLPLTIAPPLTTVYQYLSITTSTITGTVSQTTLDFSVPQSWITEHGFTIGDIVMMHYADGQWQTLDTYFISQKSGNVFYRAISPGLSYFAIAYQKGGTNMTSFTPVPTTLAPVGTSVTGTPSPVPITPKETQTVPPAPVAASVEETPLSMIIIGVIGAIAIIIGAFLVRRWWIRRQNPALFREYD